MERGYKLREKKAFHFPAFWLFSFSFLDHGLWHFLNAAVSAREKEMSNICGRGSSAPRCKASKREKTHPRAARRRLLTFHSFFLRHLSFLFVLAFCPSAMILPVELSPALALGLTLILTGALTCEFSRFRVEMKGKEEAIHCLAAFVLLRLTCSPFFLFLPSISVLSKTKTNLRRRPDPAYARSARAQVHEVSFWSRVVCVWRERRREKENCFRRIAFWLGATRDAFFCFAASEESPPLSGIVL